MPHRRGTVTHIVPDLCFSSSEAFLELSLVWVVHQLNCRTCPMGCSALPVPGVQPDQQTVPTGQCGLSFKGSFKIRLPELRRHSNFGFTDTHNRHKKKSRLWATASPLSFFRLELHTRACALALDFPCSNCSVIPGL